MVRSLELLSKVRAGTLSGKVLGSTERQSVVALLAADGLSSPEIAHVLQVSDRTVERDKQAIREHNALPRDPKLVEQLVGRLVAEAELCIQRIRRAVREKDAEPAARVDGEHRCFQILDSLTERLQKLGYLPTAATRLQADLTLHDGEVPTAEALQAEVDRLRAIADSSGNSDAALSTGVDDIEDALARAGIATQIKRVANTAEHPPP